LAVAGTVGAILGAVTPFLALALARGSMTLATWSERLPKPVRRISHGGRIAS